MRGGDRSAWRFAGVAGAVVASLGLAGTAAAHERADPSPALIVSILTPAPGEVCVRSSLTVEAQVGYLPRDPGGALAPLVPVPVQISLDATASRGTVTPAHSSLGPFRTYGEHRIKVLRYRASAPGHEDLTVTGSFAGGGSWKETLSFDVVRCKVVVVGSADMSPAVNAANEAAGGMWTMGASLDLDGEVLLDEGGATGTGTVAFAITGDFANGAGVLECRLDPQWTGSGTVDVQLDAAALDNDGTLAATLAIGAIPVNATTVSCEGAGGISASFDVPPWQVPAATLAFDPVAGPGGSAVEDFPYDTYLLPLTVSLVERSAA